MKEIQPGFEQDDDSFEGYRVLDESDEDFDAPESDEEIRARFQDAVEDSDAEPFDSGR